MHFLLTGTGRMPCICACREQEVRPPSVAGTAAYGTSAQACHQCLHAAHLDANFLDKRRARSSRSGELEESVGCLRVGTFLTLALPIVCLWIAQATAAICSLMQPASPHSRGRSTTSKLPVFPLHCTVQSLSMYEGKCTSGSAWRRVRYSPGAL